MKKELFKYIEVKSYEGGKVVKRTDVTNKSWQIVERMERGININLNHELFYTFSFESEIKLKTI